MVTRSSPALEHQAVHQLDLGDVRELQDALHRHQHRAHRESPQPPGRCRAVLAVNDLDVSLYLHRWIYRIFLKDHGRADHVPHTGPTPRSLRSPRG